MLPQVLANGPKSNQTNKSAEANNAFSKVDGSAQNGYTPQKNKDQTSLARFSNSQRSSRGLADDLLPTFKYSQIHSPPCKQQFWRTTSEKLGEKADARSAAKPRKKKIGGAK